MAERYLSRLGWRLLARRCPTRFAELDLVFDERGTLVVVEVKAGHVGPRFRPGTRLGRDALARRWRAARALARGAPHRVDLIEVRLDAGRASIEHLRGLRRPL